MRPLFVLLVLLSLSAAMATPSGDAQDNNPPAIVPEPETPTVARDVGVADLPLLTTEPPKKQPSSDIPDLVIGGQDSTFNPFAPLILPQQPSEGNAPGAPGQPATPETSEPAPETPAATETAPAPAAPTFPTAPAPEARLSRPAIPSALGESMTLSVTRRRAAPSILEAPIGSQGSALSDPLAGTIAIRTPEPAPLISAPAMVGTAPDPDTARQIVRNPGITPLTFAGTMLGHDENSTSSCSNRVSRSLSNLRVNFTAMSTGTGIFRVGDSGAPVLLALGQQLPGTRLTLSHLTTRSAEFSEDDVRHTLLLNP